MSLTKLQRQFLVLFVQDGEYDLLTTCQATGILPSLAMEWFATDAFQAQLRRYEGAQLAAMGYGPLRVMRDTLAIAHSDITQIQAVEGDITQLPRHVKIAIKKIKFGVVTTIDGKAMTYPKEVEMHDKAWALKQAADWYQIGETPEVQKARATSADDGPKRITGLIVRPPLTQAEKDAEDLETDIQELLK